MVQVIDFGGLQELHESILENATGVFVCHVCGTYITYKNFAEIWLAPDLWAAVNVCKQCINERIKSAQSNSDVVRTVVQ